MTVFMDSFRAELFEVVTIHAAQLLTSPLSCHNENNCHNRNNPANLLVEYGRFLVPKRREAACNPRSSRAAKRTGSTLLEGPALSWPQASCRGASIEEPNTLLKKKYI